jgi:hypothetical protein
MDRKIPKISKDLSSPSHAQKPLFPQATETPLFSPPIYSLRRPLFPLFQSAFDSYNPQISTKPKIGPASTRITEKKKENLPLQLSFASPKSIFVFSI